MVCDNRSVGVIVRDEWRRIALLKRAKPPVGMAPPAGHIDEHGSPQQAAVNEVEEELGLRIDVNDLLPTAIQGRRMDNICRRVGGDHHTWWIYTADRFEGELRPSADETSGAGWYDRLQLQTLVDRCYAFQAGDVPPHEYEANPGLEPVWINLLAQLGYCRELRPF